MHYIGILFIQIIYGILYFVKRKGYFRTTRGLDSLTCGIRQFSAIRTAYREGKLIPFLELAACDDLLSLHCKCSRSILIRKFNRIGRYVFFYLNFIILIFHNSQLDRSGCFGIVFHSQYSPALFYRISIGFIQIIQVKRNASKAERRLISIGSS